MLMSPDVEGIVENCTLGQIIGSLTTQPKQTHKANKYKVQYDTYGENWTWGVLYITNRQYI